jgi:hypothetical protein
VISECSSQDILLISDRLVKLSLQKLMFELDGVGVACESLPSADTEPVRVSDKKAKNFTVR